MRLFLVRKIQFLRILGKNNQQNFAIFDCGFVPIIYWMNEKGTFKGGCSELCQLSCPGKGLGAALSWIITENTLIIAINWTIDLTLLRGLEASNYLTNPCQSMWWIAISLVQQRSTVAENRWCNWTLICDYVLCTLLAMVMLLVPTYRSTYWWDPSGIGLMTRSPMDKINHQSTWKRTLLVLGLCGDLNLLGGG